MVSPRIRVAVVGLGPIGIEVARAVITTRGLALAAVVDIDPTKVGHKFSEFADGFPPDMVVIRSLDEVFGRVDAIALCAGSRLEAIAPDLVRAATAGVHVVSSCEEMAFPGDTELSRFLDEDARLGGVTFVGTGVNPGFVMDRLPLQLAGVCVSVGGVRVERIVDASLRRLPLQKKIGVGLDEAAFRAGVAAGTHGHVGLGASASLIARGLGTRLATWIETTDPVLEEGTGRVLGLRQHLLARTEDNRPIELTLQMSVGAPDPHDRIVLDSDPPLDVSIAGGTHGDRATVGAILDALKRLPHAPRGFITVAELY